ncbi:MAG: PHP domain-containing protein [Armatimonadota bacterium]
MRRFRYDTSGQWFKGNTHIHSTASDGKLTFTEIAELYVSAGFDFLFRTDHWVASSVAQDRQDYPLLWLDGIELDGIDDGAYYHVVCLGAVSPLAREMGLQAAMEAARAQGCLLILAHPHWCGNTLEETQRWPFHGVEVYNHVCHWLNGKSGGIIHWDAMLRQQAGTLAFASDDAHLHGQEPWWNGGWIMVNAPACTREALLAAIRAGNFYATCGPTFSSITEHGAQVSVRTSPVKHIRLVGPRYNGMPRSAAEGEFLTEMTFDLPAEWDYAYLEIEDAAGKRAWSNALMLPDL